MSKKKQNEMEIRHYYQSVMGHNCQVIELFCKYNYLIEKTHKNRNPYFISKDLYLYTWVDLYPDGTVKCIYSGETKDPRALILQDYELIVQNSSEFGRAYEKEEQKDYELLRQLKTVERRLKLNTEHIVPQSWFGGLEPMKRDLHHFLSAIRNAILPDPILFMMILATLHLNLIFIINVVLPQIVGLSTSSGKEQSPGQCCIFFFDIQDALRKLIVDPLTSPYLSTGTSTTKLRFMKTIAIKPFSEFKETEIHSLISPTFWNTLNFQI